MCFVARMLDEFSCDTSLRFAQRYRDVIAPRATRLERRLGAMGGYCDCEIFLKRRATRRPPAEARRVPRADRTGRGAPMRRRVISRWLREQSARWLTHRQDPRVRDVVITTWLAAWDRELEPPDGWSTDEFGAFLTGGDWVYEQLASYEYGGLLDYLDSVAGEELVARAESVVAWTQMPMSGFTLDDMCDDRLVVTDLVSDGRIEVLNIGAASDRDRGTTVLGRLVPVTGGGPEWMFDVRPLGVDAETAREAARLVSEGNEMGWIDAVTRGVVQGRLKPGFSVAALTPLGSDLVIEPPRHHHDDEPQELPGRITQLMKTGLSRNAAHGVSVCEVGLIAVEVSGAAGAASTGPHVAAVLVDPEIFAAARRHCVAARHAGPWQQLAACVPEPARTRCLELVIACRQVA